MPMSNILIDTHQYGQTGIELDNIELFIEFNEP